MEPEPVVVNEVICNGRTIVLPSLEVVKTIPTMSAGTNVDWLLHIYFARRDFVRCKRLIERELYRHLNPEYLYFVKGLIERDEGNNIEALRNLQKALDLNNKNIEIYKEIGKTLFTMGRYNQSLAIFRDAEELSTRLDHEIFHFIGELLLRSAASRNELEMAQREEQEAKAYFQKAVQTGKKVESFQRLAEILRKEKQYHKAIEVLESCLLLSPENTDVLTEIGVLYLKLNETQKAFDRLLEVIQFDKNCLRGLMAFGAILQSRNDIDAALGKYKEIAAIQPDIAELWNNIGLCFFKKQKLIVGISSLRKAIWLSPLNYNALYNLSLIYITVCLRKLEDFDNAYTAFERASNISRASSSSSSSPRNPLIHLNFALFCYETGRLAMANEQYNRFVSSAQDLVALPTEYKYHGTKLKSLLKISSSSVSSHILSPENDAASVMTGSGAPYNPIIEGGYPAPPPQDNAMHNYVNDSQQQQKQYGEDGAMRHHIAGRDNGEDYEYDKPQSNEMPLEVNAVVNN
ncbi:Bardet-Biedl syndrome 4 protein homolog [Musca vetustissima]|uniref:Bardet-Biedl syndrome 4 protein homolog n=1 Tax=Musca vetustissima TaxID=27455 RepID=UPI002AB6E8F4|nr:Bardet-Biedl syndrome 4 protein homolog [Musca vetustissima]